MAAVSLSASLKNITNMKTISIKAQRSIDAESFIRFIARHDGKILAAAALFSLAGVTFSSETLIFVSAAATMAAIYPTCKN